ncbi:hypothetical protein Vi05172_g2216 [Venturia inaequalis]|nr:hypothetical protein Vi05172_g2216 [Venturia inaequalis]
MHISTLLTIFSAAALTSAARLPDFVLVCCNPNNNNKYHGRETGECCAEIKGSADYEFSNPAVSIIPTLLLLVFLSWDL